MADVGGKACYLGPRGIDVTFRPSAIRRAVTNLVDPGEGREGAREGADSGESRFDGISRQCILAKCCRA
jgi:hypothetical protein